MPQDSPHPAERAFVLRALDFYRRLLSPSEPDLGGTLLHAGELDEEAKALVTAASIAGAASLSSTVNVDVQKQAMRDGIVDFLVTSLDEALRILKNEIRKRAPVAVCIAAPPHEIESQMAARGVLPDLRRPGVLQNSGPGESDGEELVTWSVPSAPAQWMSRLDSVALDCLRPDAISAQRWVRLSPRYLGRLGREIRTVYADREFAGRFAARARELGDAPLKIEVIHDDESRRALL